MENSFTKKDTKIIKGLAILLMFMHHLWSFSERMYKPNLRYLFKIFDESSIEYIGLFGKICVGIFFFLGGYGIYKQKQFNLFEKIKNLYLSY